MKLDFDIGSEVWRVIKVYSKEYKTEIWSQKKFYVHKISISDRGIKYQCRTEEPTLGEYIFADSTLYKTQGEAREKAAELNRSILQSL